VCTRLARLIDRTRALDAQAKHSTRPEELKRIKHHLIQLRRRGHLVDICIALLTLSALLIGITILVLFLGETNTLKHLLVINNISNSKIALLTFMGAIGLFLLALFGFLYETLISTRMINEELAERFEDIEHKQTLLNNTLQDCNAQKNMAPNKTPSKKNKKMPNTI
jgi:hypothetical protein